MLTDPNGNRSEAAFDTLGMVVGTAVMGKALPAPVEGDSLAGFNADLIEATVLAHLENPLADPHAILQRATTRLVYDLFAYYRTKISRNLNLRLPMRWRARPTTLTLPPASRPRSSTAFLYSDGFGREIQKKIQAEPGPLIEGGADIAIRAGWVRGWTVFNNKGKPVRQFEPFFSATHRFESDVRVGVSPILFYDPIARVVATLNPNHTWQKVFFDPWRQETWDVNDTVLIANPADGSRRRRLLQPITRTDYLPTWYASRIDGASWDPGAGGRAKDRVPRRHSGDRPHGFSRPHFSHRRPQQV